MKLPNLSEQSPLGAFLAVFGALGTVLAIGTIAWKDAMPVLALTAGAGWMLAAAVVHANGLKAIRIKELETELADARLQAKEFSITSSNVARAVTTILEVLPSTAEAAPPRRAPRRRANNAAAPRADGDRE
ncbi:hypothetical protein [Caulobacter radicis]|uniref:hypothetical protein n=1 Tax=Caulobacter radicis TaxID=2172650 RepID=UPI001057A957|nr:hypothetical protein [Caulobacter radicis]